MARMRQADQHKCVTQAADAQEVLKCGNNHLVTSLQENCPCVVG
jgi:hypothetical protein